MRMTRPTSVAGRPCLQGLLLGPIAHEYYSQIETLTLPNHTVFSTFQQTNGLSSDWDRAFCGAFWTCREGATWIPSTKLRLRAHRDYYPFMYFDWRDRGFQFILVMLVLIVATLVYIGFAYAPVAKDYLDIRNAAQTLADRLHKRSMNTKKATTKFFRSVKRKTGQRLGRKALTKKIQENGDVEVIVRMTLQAKLPWIKQRDRMDFELVVKAP